MHKPAIILPIVFLSSCASWDNSQYPHLNHDDVAMVHQVEHLGIEIALLANRGARECLPGQLKRLERLYLKAKQEAESGFDKDVKHSLIDANEQVHLIEHQLSWLETHTQCVAQATVAQERQQLLLYLSIDNQFALDRSRLLPDYQQALVNAATIIKKHPDWFITLTGYTDAKASDDYNQDLGLARATNVKAFLINQGVEPKQLAATSGGKRHANPTANRTEALAERTVIAQLSMQKESDVPEPAIHAIRHWHLNH
ncbi:OmpA family protein [Thaumasiovibrio sp. DFM-14]|uniref:OmpA family protein n=1 Tax=Thaumasiovibrio sp. DFM-14 TaxID=3384792 RepID=UPI00399F396B